MDIQRESDIVNVRLGMILKYALRKMDDTDRDCCEINFEHIPVTLKIYKKDNYPINIF